MARTRYKVVGLGELLWDLLPTGKQLGGAPANFAYITNLLGDEGIPASRLGDDVYGEEAIRRLKALGLTTAFIQKDAAHPTGTVKVQLDASGQPRFEICESVAWDYLEWTPEWQELASEADAICFGSLAQRSTQSRDTIRNFLQAARPEAVRIFDVNLRQQFFSPAVLSESMTLTTIVKLNHEELPRIMKLFQEEHCGEESSARRLIEIYGVKLVCITRGDGGSVLVRADQCSRHPGFHVKVADTVGAGDAFTAALTHEYLRGTPLDRMNDAANRVGAWVASEVGAMPVVGEERLAAILGRLG